MFSTCTKSAELLSDNGIATEKIKHANLVSFTFLKAFAFDQRFERKDAHDLIYCIEYAQEGLGAVAEAFGQEVIGKHGAVIAASLTRVPLRCDMCGRRSLRVQQHAHGK